MHSGPFCCLTKLGAKRAELVQKFVPRSRVELFDKERTLSAPLDPKLMFCCISYYLGAFGTVWLPYETPCKTGRISAKVRATKSRRTLRNERTQPTPLDPKLTFWCMSNYLGASGTVWTLNRCFDAFRAIWEHLGPFGCSRNSVRNKPNYCKSSCHEV